MKVLKCILQDFKISIDYFGSIENFDNISRMIKSNINKNKELKKKDSNFKTIKKRIYSFFSQNLSRIPELKLYSK